MAGTSMPGLQRFYAAAGARHPRLAAVVAAAVAAGTLSTAVQLVLWCLFTDAWRTLLFRDARLAAALVLGPAVLPPPAGFDLRVMTVATLVHGVLSLAYAAVVAALVRDRRPVAAVAIGAACGAALYAVNFYGFTRVFPWFVDARGAIALAAHLAFGVVAAVVCADAARAVAGAQAARARDK